MLENFQTCCFSCKNNIPQTVLCVFSTVVENTQRMTGEGVVFVGNRQSSDVLMPIAGRGGYLRKMFSREDSPHTYLQFIEEKNFIGSTTFARSPSKVLRSLEGG